MDRCPNCRARRRGENDKCHRCGMSLTLPLAIEQQAARLQQRAAREMLKGELLQAKETITQARHLKDSPVLSRLELFIETMRNRRLNPP